MLSMMRKSVKVVQYNTELYEHKPNLYQFLDDMVSLKDKKILDWGCKTGGLLFFSEGEIKQGLNKYDSSQSFESYLEKSYCKTASLIANSSKAIGVLSDVDQESLNSLYFFGRQLGLAFQVVDDILDFTGNDEQLGKPAASDLQSGYLTAPVFYALDENPTLSELINGKFSKKDDLDKALSLVRDSSAISKSRELAEKFASESKDSISWLPDSPSKKALLELPEFVISRLY